MDLEVLNVFVEVMHVGSFASVARERNIDPSSVSRIISGLEKELGVRLFQRTTRKLSPTEAGILYCDRIAPLLEEMKRAKESLMASKQPQGKLRVTASVSFGLKCIVPLLAEFEKIYPELTVDLLLTDARLDLVAERVDLAIRLGKLEDSTLIIQKLMSTHYGVYGSPNYLQQHLAITQPEDLTQHECLLFPLTGFRSRWIFRDSQNLISEIAVKGRIMISNAIALQECAIAEMGLALLPNWLIEEDLTNNRLVKVLPNYEVTATDFETSAWFVYPSRSYVPLKVQVAIAFFQQHLANRYG